MFYCDYNIVAGKNQGVLEKNGKNFYGAVPTASNGRGREGTVSKIGRISREIRKNVIVSNLLCKMSGRKIFDPKIVQIAYAPVYALFIGKSKQKGKFSLQTEQFFVKARKIREISQKSQN